MGARDNVIRCLGRDNKNNNNSSSSSRSSIINQVHLFRFCFLSCIVQDIIIRDGILQLLLDVTKAKWKWAG